MAIYYWLLIRRRIAASASQHLNLCWLVTQVILTQQLDQMERNIHYIRDVQEHHTTSSTSMSNAGIHINNIAEVEM